MAVIITLTVIAIYTTVTVYLGIFGYNNPDPGSCWVVRDLDSAGKTRAAVLQKATAMAVDVTDGYPIDMHKVFRAWFRWGFWSQLALVFGLILSGLIANCYKLMAGVLSSLTCGVYIVNGLMWVVFGTIWRFSTAGKIAAGDKLERDAGIS